MLIFLNILRALNHETLIFLQIAISIAHLTAAMKQYIQFVEIENGKIILPENRTLVYLRSGNNYMFCCYSEPVESNIEIKYNSKAFSALDNNLVYGGQKSSCIESKLYYFDSLERAWLDRKDNFTCISSKKGISNISSVIHFIISYQTQFQCDFRNITNRQASAESKSLEFSCKTTGGQPRPDLPVCQINGEYITLHTNLTSTDNSTVESYFSLHNWKEYYRSNLSCVVRQVCQEKSCRSKEIFRIATSTKVELLVKSDDSCSFSRKHNEATISCTSRNGFPFPVHNCSRISSNGALVAIKDSSQNYSAETYTTKSLFSLKLEERRGRRNFTIFCQVSQADEFNSTFYFSTVVGRSTTLEDPLFSGIPLIVSIVLMAVILTTLVVMVLILYKRRKTTSTPAPISQLTQ